MLCENSIAYFFTHQVKCIYLDLIYNNIVTFINCMHIGHVNQQQHTMLNLGDFDIILEISTYLQTVHH